MTIPFTIALEGIDGSGKSTVAKALSDKFTEQGITVQIVDSTTAPEMAKTLYDLFLNTPREQMSTELRGTLSTGYILANCEHFENNLDDKPDVLIYDRHLWSSAVYQYASLAIESTLDYIHEMFDPDLTVWLRPNLKLALERNEQARVGEPDQFEAEASLHICERRDHHYEQCFMVWEPDNLLTIKFDDLMKIDDMVDEIITAHNEIALVKSQNRAFVESTVINPK